MKRLSITILILCLFASFGFAQGHKDGAHKGGGLIQLMQGAAEGDIIYWDGTAWVKLSIGSNGTVLSSNGTTVSWGAKAGGDSVSMNDDGWIGLGGSAGRMEFDDQTLDEVNILAQLAGVNTQTPGTIGTFAASGNESHLMVYSSNASARLIAYGDTPQINAVDVGGAGDDKWMQYHVDDGVMAYRSLDDDGGIRVDNIFTLDMGTGAAGFVNSIAQQTYVIRKHVALSGASDASATNWFTITTADETGSADGGMYSVHVHLTAGEATAASGAVNTASVSLIAHWTRIMASAGTGANSAVVEISESASADEGTGAISAVTITVTETSEFVQQILLNVDTSGGTFDGFAIVELVYSDFTTAPVIN